MQTISKFMWITALAALMVFAPKDALALSATVQQIQGEVLVAKAALPDTWEAVTTDTVLNSGDSVKTRKGSCALVYGDQATFAVEENTTLTVQETPAVQDLKLLIGKIKGKVNKQNAAQPFQVTTPAAVATVRGTEVDFGFNDEGQLTVDLHNGKIEVVNDDADMQLDLDGKKSISVKYDKEANIILIKNGCGSDGPINSNVLGNSFALNPCEEKEVSLATAERGLSEIPPANNEPEDPENPDEQPEEQPEALLEPMSPTTPE